MRCVSSILTSLAITATLPLLPGLGVASDQDVLTQGSPCPDGETLFWHCNADTQTDFLLCGGRTAARFSPPYLALYESRDGVEVSRFPSDRAAPLAVESNLYTANYDLVLKSGSRQVRLFEDIRRDDDAVEFSDPSGIDAGASRYCSSRHDELLEAAAHMPNAERIAEIAEELVRRGDEIGALRPLGRTRPLSNSLRFENGALIIDRHYVTTVPMGDGRFRNVHDSVTETIDPYRIVSFSVGFGNPRHLIEGEDQAYCDAIGLVLDVRSEADKSATHPVGYYACADQAEKMRGVYNTLSSLLSALAAKPLHPPALRADATWQRPPLISLPTLVIVERDCLVELNPFDQVCAAQRRNIGDLQTGKDHTIDRVVLSDPAGLLTGKDWQVRISLSPPEDTPGGDAQPPVLVLSPQADPAAVAEQLFKFRPWFFIADNDAAQLSRQISQDRERLLYTLSPFVVMGAQARYELIVDGEPRPLGSVEVTYPGS